MFRIAVFASGTGSNFRAIHQAARSGKLQDTAIVGLISNNPGAGACEYARSNDIPVEIINKKRFPEEGGVSRRIIETLDGWNPDLAALAGYMKKLDATVVESYKNRILNIHPALLPAFGGKGMYGMHVHEAVIDYGVQYTGVTVHVVDFQYDTGPIVLQKVVPVHPNDTPESLQQKVLKVEHATYTEAIRLFVDNRVEIRNRKVIVRE